MSGKRGCAGSVHDTRRGVHPGHRLHRDPDHPGRPRRLPGRARPLPAGRGPGLPVGQPGDHRPPAARPGGRDLDGDLRPDPRRAELDLRPRSRRRRPGARLSNGCSRPTSPAIPDYPRGITVPGDGRRSRPGRWSPTTTRRSPSTSPPSGPTYHRAGAPDLYPEALRDEIDEVADVVYRDVNNGVYRCGFAGSQEAYERAYDRLFARLDWLSDRLADAALPGRRHDHRGRRPAVHHAGPLRRRLPRPLQVQPAEAHRDAGAVGLRPGPVPDARLRRHHRLRADQAALLPGAHRHQPDADRAGAARTCGLADPARPRAARRPPVRRRHAARPPLPTEPVPAEDWAPLPPTW